MAAFLCVKIILLCGIRTYFQAGEYRKLIMNDKLNTAYSFACCRRYHEVNQTNFVEIAALESMINMCQLGMGVTLLPETDIVGLGIQDYKKIDHRCCEIEKFICYRSGHFMTGIEQQLVSMIVTSN